jgi:hypothetical protein
MSVESLIIMRPIMFPLFVGFLSTAALAQDDYSGGGDMGEVRDVETDSSGSGPSTLPKKVVPNTMKDDWKPEPRKTYTPAERQAECRKYEGKYIGYYEAIYKVENCKRREIKDTALLNSILKQGKNVVNVENDTFGKLRVGKPIDSPAKGASFSCNRVNNNYVISHTSDIFYVENCKKRAFPDYDTYETHKRDSKATQKLLMELTTAELATLPDGKAFPSILNNPTEASTDEILEIIPLHEACRGVDGKYASYFSRLYKIENCRKREITNPEAFLLEKRNANIPVVELKADQWLSLPEGKPIETAKKEPENNEL